MIRRRLGDKSDHWLRQCLFVNGAPPGRAGRRRGRADYTRILNRDL
jgi:hypothetical protein